MERANKYLQWCEAGDKPSGPPKTKPSKVVEISKGPRKTK